MRSSLRWQRGTTTFHRRAYLPKRGWNPRALWFFFSEYSSQSVTLGAPNISLSLYIPLRKRPRQGSSMETLPGTAVVSFVATNRQLVQTVSGFGLCFFGQHFALTVLLLQSLRVMAGPAARGLYAEVSRAAAAVPPMEEQEARTMLTKADARLLTVKASVGVTRSALQAGTLDAAAAAKLLAAAAAEARALASEVAMAHATLSRLSAFASTVDPAAVHGGLAALGAAAAAAWGAVVRSSAGEVLSGATLGSDAAALLGRLATPAVEALHEVHLAATTARDDEAEAGGWSAWLPASRAEGADGTKEDTPLLGRYTPLLYCFGGLSAMAARYLQLPPHERRWADAALHAAAAMVGFLFMRRAKVRCLFYTPPYTPPPVCRPKSPRACLCGCARARARFVSR